MSRQEGERLRDDTRAALNDLAETVDPKMRRVVELLHERLSQIERRLEADDRNALRGAVG
jgi:hypothetical protein